MVPALPPDEGAFGNMTAAEPQAGESTLSKQLPCRLLPKFVTFAPPSSRAWPQPSRPKTSALDGDLAVSEPHLAFGDHRVPLWIVDAITRGAEASGADPVYMMALADKELSFIPHNKAATSSAEGLFQFIASTWLEAIRSFGAKHGYGAEAAAIDVSTGSLSSPTKRCASIFSVCVATRMCPRSWPES